MINSSKQVRHLKILKLAKGDILDATTQINDAFETIKKKHVIDNVVNHFCIPMMFGPNGVYDYDATSFGSFMPMHGKEDLFDEQVQMFVFWHMMFALLSQIDQGTPAVSANIANKMADALEQYRENPKAPEPFSLFGKTINAESSYISQSAVNGYSLFDSEVASKLLPFYSSKTGVKNYDYFPNDNRNERLFEKFAIYMEPLRCKSDTKFNEDSTDKCAGFILHIFQKDPNFSFIKALENYFNKSSSFMKENSSSSGGYRRTASSKKTPISNRHAFLMNFIKEMHGYDTEFLRIDVNQWYKMTSGYLSCIERIFEILEAPNDESDDSDEQMNDVSQNADEWGEWDDDDDDDDGSNDDVGSKTVNNYVASKEMFLSDVEAVHLSPTNVFSINHCNTFLKAYPVDLTNVRKRLTADADHNRYIFTFMRNNLANHVRHPLDCVYKISLMDFNRESIANSYFPWSYCKCDSEYYFKEQTPLYVILEENSRKGGSKGNYFKRLRPKRHHDSLSSVSESLRPQKKQRSRSIKRSNPHFDDDSVDLPPPSSFAVVNKIVAMGEENTVLYEKLICQHKLRGASARYSETLSSEDHEDMLNYCQEMEKFRTDMFNKFWTVVTSPTPTITDVMVVIVEYFKNNLEGVSDLSKTMFVPMHPNSTITWMDTYELWLYNVMKVDFDTFHDIPHLLILLHSCSDTYRQEFNLHLCTLFSGIHGAGKSHKLQLLHDHLLIKGTCSFVQNFSPKSLNSDLDLSDKINLMDETISAFSGSSNSKRNQNMDDSSSGLTTAVVKQLLSAQMLQHQYCDYGKMIKCKDGEISVRVTNELKTAMIGTWHFCTNNSIKKMNQPIADRLIALETSKKRDLTKRVAFNVDNLTDHTIDLLGALIVNNDVVATSQLAELSGKDVTRRGGSRKKPENSQQSQLEREKLEFLRNSSSKGPHAEEFSYKAMVRRKNINFSIHFDQASHAMVEKLIHCCALPSPYMTAGAMVLSRLCDYMNNHGVPFGNRDYSKCLLMARVLTIKNAIHQVFKVYGCDRNTITFKNLIHVAPYLVCSFDNIIHAFTLLSCQFINTFKIPILDALAKQCNVDTSILHYIQNHIDSSKDYDERVYKPRSQSPPQQDTATTGDEIPDNDEDSQIIDVNPSMDLDHALPNATDDGERMILRNITTIWNERIHKFHRLYLLDYINHSKRSIITWHRPVVQVNNVPTKVIDLNYIVVSCRGLYNLATILSSALADQEITSESMLENLQGFTNRRIKIENPMPMCLEDDLINPDAIHNIRALMSSSYDAITEPMILEELQSDLNTTKTNVHKKYFKLSLHALNEKWGGELMLKAIQDLCYKKLNPRLIVTGMETEDGSGLLKFDTERYSTLPKAPTNFMSMSRKYVDKETLRNLYFNPMNFNDVTSHVSDDSQANDEILATNFEEIRNNLEDGIKNRINVIDEDIDDWAWKRHFEKNHIPYEINQTSTGNKEYSWYYYDEEHKLEKRPLPTPNNQARRIREKMAQNSQLKQKLLEEESYLL